MSRFLMPTLNDPTSFTQWSTQSELVRCLGHRFNYLPHPLLPHPLLPHPHVALPVSLPMGYPAPEVEVLPDALGRGKIPLQPPIKVTIIELVCSSLLQWWGRHKQQLVVGCKHRTCRVDLIGWCIIDSKWIYVKRYLNRWICTVSV